MKEQFIFEDYINSKNTDYAILIKGCWGCGKTHFYNTCLEPMINQNNKIPIYISVYGRKKVEDLQRDIILQLLKHNLKKVKPTVKNKKIIGFGKSMKKKYEKSLSGVGISLEEVSTTILNASINGAIDKSLKLLNSNMNSNIQIQDMFSEFKNTVLIIDDFERSKLSTIELMGFIYRLIEQENLKVFVIANEEEIDTSTDQNNEFKILTAIKWAENKKLENSNDRIKELEIAKKELFKQTDIYKKMKEKLFGFSYEVKQDADNVVQSIISGYEDDEFKAFLVSNNDSIKKVFQSCGYNNFRLLKRALDLAKMIYLKVKKQEGCNYNSEYFEEIFLTIFCSLLIFYIELNYNPREVQEGVENIETQIMNLSIYSPEDTIISRIYSKYSDIFNENNSKLIYLKSISNLILSGSLDINSFNNDISMINSIFDVIREKNDSLRELMNFREMKSDEIEENFNEVLENIRKGKYNTSDFKKSLSVLVFFIEKKVINYKKSDFYKIYNDNITKMTLDDKHVLYGYAFEYASEDEEFKKLNKRWVSVKNNIISHSEKELVKKLIQLINDDFQNGITEMNKFYEVNAKFGFFKYMNKENLIQILKKCDIHELNKLLELISTRKKYVNIVDDEEKKCMESLCHDIIEEYSNLYGIEAFLINEYLK